MLKLPFGEHKNQYTIPKSYQYTTHLSYLWTAMAWLIAVSTAVAAVGAAFVWRAYGTSVINSETMMKLFGAKLGDLIANLSVLGVILFCLSLLFSYSIKLCIASYWTIPTVIISTVSVFAGTVGVQVFPSLLLRLFNFYNRMNSQEKFEQLYSFSVEPRALAQLHDIFLYGVIFTLFLVCVASLFFLGLALYGLLSLVETTKRVALPAKTLGKLKIRYSDGLSDTKRSIAAIVEENLQLQRLSKAEQKEELENVLRDCKNYSTLVLYENEVPVGFLVRSSKYDLLLQLWVARRKTKRRFGSYLMVDFLTQAMDRHAELPLGAAIPRHRVKAMEPFLLAHGWVQSGEQLETGEVVYSWDLDLDSEEKLEEVEQIS